MKFDFCLIQAMEFCCYHFCNRPYNVYSSTILVLRALPKTFLEPIIEVLEFQLRDTCDSLFIFRLNNCVGDVEAVANYLDDLLSYAVNLVLYSCE